MNIYVVYNVINPSSYTTINQSVSSIYNMGNLFSNFENKSSSRSSSLSVRATEPCYDVNFGFMDNDAHTQKMTECAYITISRLEKWEYLRNYVVDENKGFMWTDEPTINELMREIDHDYYDGGHSGGSMACTIRNMDFIAKHGLEKFAENWESQTRGYISTTIENNDVDNDDETVVIY